jgi:uncharacterized protein
VTLRRTRASATVHAVVLAHGAGSGADHPTLVAISERLDAPTIRHEFDYRVAGRHFPDPMPVLIESFRAAVAALDVDPTRVVLGGRSLGGRVASMLIADGHPAAGLVAIGYPLHPPKRPEKLRVEHLDRIMVPTLFVSGTRDSFGTTDELAAAHALVNGPVTAKWIDNGRHELLRAHAAIAELVARWIDELPSLTPQESRPTRGRKSS